MLVVFTSLGGGSVVPSDACCSRGSSCWSRNQLPSLELKSLTTHQAGQRQRRAQRHRASAATGIVAEAQTNPYVLTSCDELIWLETHQIRRRRHGAQWHSATAAAAVAEAQNTPNSDLR